MISYIGIGIGIVDIGYRYRRSFFTETLGWGGVRWAKWFCRLERQGLGRRLGREEPVRGVDAVARMS